jgi:hypothetical protein
VNFTVVVDAVPSATYQWFKNGTAIAGATNATLTLENVQLSAAGNYHVVARNLFDGTPSVTVTLQVSAAPPPPPPPPPTTPPTPPAISTQPGSFSIAEGTTATFRVSATGAAPLSYQWRKNGTGIPGATATELSIATATP